MHPMELPKTLKLAASYTRSLYSFLVDAAPHPFSASFTVTNRCNLRCSYCNFPFLERQELEMGQIAVLFDRLRQLGVRRLGLLGGEPLVRSDIGEILALADARGFHVGLNTNLTLYERHADTVARADLVFTSLDGRPFVHEQSRGPGSADAVLDAIRDLRARERPVVAICVLTPQNLGEIDWLLEQAEGLGFQLHFQPQCLDAQVVRGTWAGDVDQNEALRAAWRGLWARKKRGAPIASSAGYLQFLAGWDDYGVTARPAPGSRCAAGRGFLYIDPMGRAYPCVYTKGRVDPVDLLADDWHLTKSPELPCQTCIVGPMLEFNLLYRRPWSAALSALRSYGLSS